MIENHMQSMSDFDSCGRDYKPCCWLLNEVATVSTFFQVQSSKCSMC